MPLNYKHFIKNWSLDAEGGAYDKNGEWFHIPKNFPAVLVDSKGYIYFTSLQQLEAHPQLRLNKETDHIHCYKGINALDGYIQVGEGNFFPDEVEKGFIEGGITTVRVNRYERNNQARNLCITAHKPICAVCNFDFKSTYGSIGEGFIHVHHLKPLNEITESYIVNPTIDLIPVCPNCHAMLHRKNPPFTIAELKAKLADNRS